MAGDKDEGKDDDLVMVGDGVEEFQPTEEEQARRRAAESDGGAGDDDGEDDDDDRKLGAGEAEDEDKIEARRQERKSRRQRQKEARDRDQTELRFLRNRNEQLERRFSGLEKRVGASEAATVDGRISQIERAIRSADAVYAKAIEDGEGKDAAEALGIRDKLRDQLTAAKSYKERQTAAARDAESREDEPPPALVEHVRNWHSRNSWFKFDRSDEDSAIAGAIDDMLARQGHDPNSASYYEELDKRIAKRLPHLKSGAQRGNGRDDDDDDERREAARREDGGRREEERKGSGPRFRVGGRERILKPNEVHVSRDRREAMEEAGVWDDPKLRSRYLKRYADWDRENSKA